MLVLATVPVHETILANHIFIVRFGEEGGVYKNSMLRMLVMSCENAENYGWSLRLIYDINFSN